MRKGDARLNDRDVLAAACLETYLRHRHWKCAEVCHLDRRSEGLPSKIEDKVGSDLHAKAARTNGVPGIHHTKYSPKSRRPDREDVLPRQRF